VTQAGTTIASKRYFRHCKVLCDRPITEIFMVPLGSLSIKDTSRPPSQAKLKGRQTLSQFQITFPVYLKE
jgi:hypothetical protein